jgi:hypothetical protein
MILSYYSIPWFPYSNNWFKYNIFLVHTNYVLYYNLHHILQFTRYVSICKPLHVFDNAMLVAE